VLNPGDRVRVIREGRLHEYRMGDRGTVLTRSHRSDNGSGTCYIVSMDGSSDGIPAVFYEDEIEPEGHPH
jgi:hypothetical protein